MEPGAVLVAEPNRPTAEELTRCRLLAVRLINASLRGDMAATFVYTPKTVSDLQYVLTAMTELAAELVQTTPDPVEAISELRRLALRGRSTPQGSSDSTP